MKKSFARFVEVVLFGLLLTAFLPAWPATFARTTEGALASAGLRGDFKRGSKFVLTEKGTLQGVCVFADTTGSGTGEQLLRFALYRDRNGVPAELVAETVSVSFSPTQNPATWYCLGSAAAPQYKFGRTTPMSSGSRLLRREPARFRYTRNIRPGRTTIDVAVTGQALKSNRAKPP